MILLLFLLIYIMELYELELKQLVEVKLLRLNKPKIMPNNLIPLNGVYNSLTDLNQLDNLSHKQQNFENKFKEFGMIDENSVGVDNMFSIYTSFGKVLYCEQLEALLIVNNLSDKEIKLKDFKIKISNEVLENYENMFRKTDYFILNTSNIITIPPNHFYNHRIKIYADIMCKYALEIDLQYTNYYFNEEFIKHSTNKIIKTISSHYFIEANTSHVVKKYYKKFLFATNLPFKIKEKFINDSLERSLLEINVINQCPYNLNIVEFALYAGDLGSGGKISGNSLTENTLKNINMESDEEINLVYLADNFKSFNLNVNNKYLTFRIVFYLKLHGEIVLIA